MSINNSVSTDRIIKLMSVAIHPTTPDNERANSISLLQAQMRKAQIDASHFHIKFSSSDFSVDGELQDRLEAAQRKIRQLEDRIAYYDSVPEDVWAEKTKYFEEMIRLQNVKADLSTKIRIIEEENDAIASRYEELREKFDSLQRSYNEICDRLRADSESKKENTRSDNINYTNTNTSDQGVKFVPIASHARTASDQFGRYWKSIVAYHLGIPIAKLNAWLIAEFLPSEMAMRFSEIIMLNPSAPSRKSWSKADVCRLKAVLNAGADDLTAALIMTEYCGRAIYETSIASRRRALFRSDGWQPDLRK